MIKKAEAILKTFGVSEYLHYTFQREESIKTQYIGRGRGGPNRPKRTIKEVRYQITTVHQDEDAMSAAYWRMGKSEGKAYTFGDCMQPTRILQRYLLTKPLYSIVKRQK